MSRRLAWGNIAVAALSVSAVVGVLYMMSRTDYLLFHSVVEIFTMVVAFSIFVIAWNARQFSDNGYLGFIGMAFPFIGAVTLIHALSYHGMQVFPDHDANLPTQLWLVIRYVHAAAFLLAPLFLTRRLAYMPVLLSYAVVITGLTTVIFLDMFPDAYIEGSGLTPFKIASEYAVSTAFLVGAALLWRGRRHLDAEATRLLVLSLVVAAAAEMSFTLYVDVYGFFNMLGHLFIVASFYLVYRAVVAASFVRPHDLLFRNLKQSEEALRHQRDFAEGLIETAPVVIMVLDREGRILRFNPAMEQLSGYSPEQVRNRDYFELFLPEGGRLEARAAFHGALSGGGERAGTANMLTRAGEERQIEWYYRPMSNGNSGSILAVGQDVTERNRAAAERERLIADLRLALSEVKVLSGMLPICASCKKIRDDKGYWEQIEVYIREHSDAEFTHGICPDCLARLYPDLSAEEA